MPAAAAPNFLLIGISMSQCTDFTAPDGIATEDVLKLRIEVAEVAVAVTFLCVIKQTGQIAARKVLTQVASASARGVDVSGS